MAGIEENENRKGTECSADFIPFCPVCGELLETNHRWNSGGERHEIMCQCGQLCILEAQIVFSVVNPKPKRKDELS